MSKLIDLYSRSHRDIFEGRGICSDLKVVHNDVGVIQKRPVSNVVYVRCFCVCFSDKTSE